MEMPERGFPAVALVQTLQQGRYHRPPMKELRYWLWAFGLDGGLPSDQECWEWGEPKAQQG